MKKHGRFFGALLYLPYRIVFALLWPIIERTTVNLAESIRATLNDKKKMDELTHQKLKRMGEAFGVVRGEQNNFEFCAGGTGTLWQFMEERFAGLKVDKQGQTFKYGSRLTEEELVSHFTEYLIEEFIPKSTWSLGGWSVGSIRRRMILHFLKRTQLIEGLMKQGLASATSAQYSVRKLLSKQITQINETLKQQSQRQEVEGKRYVDPVLKSQIITFIDKLFEAAQYNGTHAQTGELKEIENTWADKMQAFRAFLNQQLEISIPDFDELMKKAAVTAAEQAINVLYNKREVFVEEQLQEIIRFGQSYFTPDIAPSELEGVNRELEAAISELSFFAVNEAVDSTLDSLSGETYQRNKEFVKAEKDFLFEQMGKIEALAPRIWRDLFAPPPEVAPLDPEARFKRGQEALSIMVYELELLMKHISSSFATGFLQNSCYEDIRSDYYTTTEKLMKGPILKMLNALEELAKAESRD